MKNFNLSSTLTWKFRDNLNLNIDLILKEGKSRGWDIPQSSLSLSLSLGGCSRRRVLTTTYYITALKYRRSVPSSSTRHKRGYTTNSSNNLCRLGAYRLVLFLLEESRPSFVVVFFSNGFIMLLVRLVIRLSSLSHLLPATLSISSHVSLQRRRKTIGWQFPIQANLLLHIRGRSYKESPFYRDFEIMFKKYHSITELISNQQSIPEWKFKIKRIFQAHDFLVLFYPSQLH